MYDLRLAMKHAEIQRGHREDEHVEPNPEPKLIIHGFVNGGKMARAPPAKKYPLWNRPLAVAEV
jgi:hypothetical protein